MITEDYVSFETAKLLKEKGFDEECSKNGYYVINKYSTGVHWNPVNYNIGDTTFEYSINNVISKPTLQMAMKWLREVHNLSIEVYRNACGYIGCVVVIPSGTDIKFIEGDGDDLPSGTYTKWEYACEAALKYSIENLI